ncbi:MAG: hypothetical protein QW051_01545 [Candidatus Aenigmatarchaeota archaeon]
MKKNISLFIAFVIFEAFFINLTFAQPIDVFILPDNKIISVNSPAVIKVDPKTTETPIRVVWSVYNTGEKGMGSFEYVDGKWICYFSNDDGNATCGPSPFFLSGETEFYVYVVTPTKTYNVTIPLNVTNINLDLKNVNKVDNTVYMYLYMAKKDMLKYSIYKEDLTIYQTDRPLEYNSTVGRYEGSITLNPGIYYFVFFVNDSGSYGATFKRIEIPSSDFLNISTNKNEYWKGEKIVVSGTTNANKVLGELRFPDGTKALDLDIPVAANRSFSFSFFSQSDWPEGKYEIRTTKPLAKILNFTITEFFEITPKSITATVNKTDGFEEIINVKNIRSSAVNISIDVSGDLNPSYVSLADDHLQPQQSTTISISIPSVNNKIEGNIILKTDEGLELKIPVSISVSEIIPSCPEQPTIAKALEIDKNTMIMIKDCLVNENIVHSVKLRNKGNLELEDFDYEIEDIGGENSLEYLDISGKINIPVSGLSIQPGSSTTIEVSITPEEAGKYNGIIKFKSGNEEAYLLVSLNCFEDISEDLENLEEKLSKLNLPEETTSDIYDYLTQAKNSIALANYGQGYEYYTKAKAQIELLESGNVSKPIDLTMIIIIIVVMVLIVVLVWFVKFRKSTPPVEGVDELENF